MLEETNRATDDNTLLALVQFEAGCSHDINGIHNNRGSFDIWIDRCSVVDYDDGLIDIMRQSIYISCLQYFQFNYTEENLLDYIDPNNDIHSWSDLQMAICSLNVASC
ncbi:uncharacterized protein LOC125531466 [Triticum urartu]|uniref:uncharacterized protein LOC125531466 n=1 Tax=Triticum urartu TaxID=4572 RepID=UPI002042F34D|nr:uncharacterized protein LOC125531466 [Triticum urartu]